MWFLVSAWNNHPCSRVCFLDEYTLTYVGGDWGAMGLFNLPLKAVPIDALTTELDAEMVSVISGAVTFRQRKQKLLCIGTGYDK